MATLVSASETTKYAVASIVDGKRSPALVDHGHGERAAARDVAQRRPEAALGQHRGMDAAREVAQLADRALGLVARLTDEVERVVAAPEPVARHPQVQRDGDEPLLRPVVQVALQAPALGVGGGDDARLRGAQVDDARVELGLAAVVSSARATAAWMPANAHSARTAIGSRTSPGGQQRQRRRAKSSRTRP